MSIKIVKMINGDEIISGYVDNGDSVELSKPHQVSIVPGSGGRPTVGLVPYPISTNDDKITVNSSFVAFVCNASEEFASQYTSMTGNGIVVPKKEIILN